ncbi:hypothetical protein KL921_002935 [Ogataea angusta]|nr:hypothetical protein KL921_002935 [Ogataea angusta]
MSSNITWHHNLTTEERNKLTGQKGATVWLTGLSASGKSTIACGLERLLLTKGINAYRLDGDNVRFGLNKDLGFSEKDRAENIRRISEVSKLFADSSAIAITSFISPYKGDRAQARKLHEEAGLPFVEVFVDVPLEVAEKRDPKGLYKKAREGLIKNFTGIDDPYEAPEKPEIHLNTSTTGIEECITAIAEYLASHGITREIQPGRRDVWQLRPVAGQQVLHLGVLDGGVVVALGGHFGHDRERRVQKPRALVGVEVQHVAADEERQARAVDVVEVHDAVGRQHALVGARVGDVDRHLRGVEADCEELAHVGADLESGVCFFHLHQTVQKRDCGEVDAETAVQMKRAHQPLVFEVAGRGVVLQLQLAGQRFVPPHQLLDNASQSLGPVGGLAEPVDRAEDVLRDGAEPDVRGEPRGGRRVGNILAQHLWQRARDVFGLQERRLAHFRRERLVEPVRDPEHARADICLVRRVRGPAFAEPDVAGQLDRHIGVEHAVVVAAERAEEQARQRQRRDRDVVLRLVFDLRAGQHQGERAGEQVSGDGVGAAGVLCAEGHDNEAERAELGRGVVCQSAEPRGRVVSLREPGFEQIDVVREIDVVEEEVRAVDKKHGLLEREGLEIAHDARPVG